MFNTFNMGVGMSMAVSPDSADRALEILRAKGVEAYVMGEIVRGKTGSAYAERAWTNPDRRAGLRRRHQSPGPAGRQKAGALHSGEIVLVISNKPGAYALERARAAGVESLTITRKDCGGQEGFEAALQAALEERGVELIILAGFLSILSADFTRRWENRILNVHPSLIPSFCGKGFYGLKVHEAALAYGVKVTGATVHFVNEIPDGGQILLQQAVAVQPGDTPETLQRRVMEQAEWILLPQAAELVSARFKTKRSRTMTDFLEFLRNNSYPGRGIAVGKDRVYYFIMGRSENSRNRIFSLTEDGIRTEAYDASKLVDPSLIIYHPVRAMGEDLIVTNGDQTDTIRDMGDFRAALRHPGV